MQLARSLAWVCSTYLGQKQGGTCFTVLEPVNALCAFSLPGAAVYEAPHQRTPIRFQGPYVVAEHNHLAHTDRAKGSEYFQQLQGFWDSEVSSTHQGQRAALYSVRSETKRKKCGCFCMGAPCGAGTRYGHLLDGCMQSLFSVTERQLISLEDCSNVWLCCAVLYKDVVLCCFVLCCVTLCYPVLCRVVLCCAVQRKRVVLCCAMQQAGPSYLVAMSSVMVDAVFTHHVNACGHGLHHSR
jgi:hypothetical protein